jgi:hypothetical protein
MASTSAASAIHFYMLSRAFSAYVGCNHSPGGDAPGCFETAPLALEQPRGEALRDREPRRIKVNESFFQFLQLRCRAMHFYPGEIAHNEQFREQRANIVQMCENAFGVGVTFAAENFVAVNGEHGCTFAARLVADVSKKSNIVVTFAEGQKFSRFRSPYEGSTAPERAAGQFSWCRILDPNPRPSEIISLSQKQ